jgi:trimeric autotransporter adhesin
LFKTANALKTFFVLCFFILKHLFMKLKLYKTALIAITLFFYQHVFSQANTALSNLVSPTAVNRDLSPGSNNTYNLGVGATNWKNIYIGGLYYLKNLRVMHAPGTSNFFAGPNAGNLATTGTFNAGVGNQAMELNTTGSNNTALGFTALRSNTLGGRNTAVGLTALYNNTGGGYNTSIGERTMYNNKTGIYNTAIGSLSLFSNTTGALNAGLGYQTLYKNTTGYSNVAIGASALYTNTTGSGTIAIGDSALLKNNNIYHNVAIGSKALMNNTTGYYNVAVGYQSLYSNVTSGYNTAIGYQVLYSNTGSAYDNTGVGFQALYRNTSGNLNTATGVWALLNNTTGSFNVADGVYALEQNTTGNDNVASGYYAAFYNNGNSNVAIGTHALFSALTSRNTVAVGDSALLKNTVPYSYNTAVGSKTLAANTTGIMNTAVGFNALNANATGTQNTAVGTFASLVTTGSYNTSVGAYAGYYNSTNGTFIGWDTYGMSAGSTNSTAIGYHAPTTANNQVRLGDGNVTSIGGQVGWSAFSDGRYKKDIQEDVPGMEFINQLRPVTYHFDAAGYHTALRAITKLPEEQKYDPASPSERAAEAEKSKVLYTGFIAQEVEAAAKKLKYDFSGVDAPKNDKDFYGLRYGDFVVPIVKGMQQLSKENDSLKEKITQLEQSLAEIQSILKIKPSNVTLSGASVGQNNPNPFRGNTIISYNVPSGLNSAQIVVYDAAGKTLKQFNVASQGRGTVNLDAAMLPSGTYHYSLYVDGKVIDTKKMVLIK